MVHERWLMRPAKSRLQCQLIYPYKLLRYCRENFSDMVDVVIDEQFPLVIFPYANMKR